MFSFQSVNVSRLSETTTPCLKEGGGGVGQLRKEVSDDIHFVPKGEITGSSFYAEMAPRSHPGAGQAVVHLGPPRARWPLYMDTLATMGRVWDIPMSHIHRIPESRWINLLNNQLYTI